MRLLVVLVLASASLSAAAVAAPDYERRVVDIPMRDGVRLHTVIVVPRGARGAPVLLTRTPYDAESMTDAAGGNSYATILASFDNPVDTIVDGGYIRVVQDIRGRYRSGGDTVMMRPLAGTRWNRARTDEATDAWDTVEWLTRHVREGNGRVGLIGTSYDAWAVLMALTQPHPAVRVAVPINPMVDTWVGDDWFHHGAFRQMMTPFFRMMASRDGEPPFPAIAGDPYDAYLRAGSAAAFGASGGMERVAFWRQVLAHPTYDAFWRDQAMDRVLARARPRVPLMLVHGLWDADDIHGAPALYRALRPVMPADRLFLTIGPWTHTQALGDGSRTGPLAWTTDTARWWRRTVLAPFLARYLRGIPAHIAPVTAFRTGQGAWQRLAGWPPAPAATPLYLHPGGSLGFAPGAPGQGPRTADFVADPANPVRFQADTRMAEEHWSTWLTQDQRFAAERGDVLTFSTPPLARAMTVAGVPMVRLRAATSGGDADWVVKLIDGYPAGGADGVASGYQLPVAMDIFRGRYRRSLSKAEAIPADRLLPYRFALPTVNHVFRPCHRIVVQVQSSWFPLYDRNPQRFVPSIFRAAASDHVAARHRLAMTGLDGSRIDLPILPEPSADPSSTETAP